MHDDYLLYYVVGCFVLTCVLVWGRFKEATQLYQIHEYHAAVTEFTRAIFLNPKSAEYYAGRGKAYRELCDFKV